MPENASKLKQESQRRAAAQKQSMIQMNKESYAKKVNSLMYGSQQLSAGPSRSNDNSALGAMSKRGMNPNICVEDEMNVQDYIGNKISLRRSIENMNYETKQFKKTTRNEQIDLKQELMGEQNQSIQQ